MFQFQSQRYSPLALHKAKRRFYLCTQDRNTTCQQYHETFRNNVDVIEYCGGVISKDPGLINGKLIATELTHANADAAQLHGAEDAVLERVLACALPLRERQVLLRQLLEDLENDYTQGTDNYPATLQQAYTLLVHWKQDPRNLMHLMGEVTDGVAFTNVGTKGAQQEGNAHGGRRNIADITCFNCRGKGHYA
jgi:hypothetical protein